jgi:hypothetical protein
MVRLDLSLIILWGTMFYTFGIAAYVIAPWFIAGWLSRSWRQKIGDMYLKNAMLSMWRAIYVDRKHAGADIVPSSYDASAGTEEVTLDGEERGYEDPDGLMGRLHGKPFGVVIEPQDVITRPVLADIGEHHRRAFRQGDHEVGVEETIEHENGNTETVTSWYEQVHYAIPSAPRLLDLREAIAFIPGDARDDYSSTAYEFGEKSQRGFHTNVGMMEVAVLGTLFGIGLIGTWFVVNYGSSAGSSVGSTVPLVLGVVV